MVCSRYERSPNAARHLTVFNGPLSIKRVIRLCAGGEVRFHRLIAATAMWLVLVCTLARRIREARRSGGGQRRIPLIRTSPTIRSMTRRPWRLDHPPSAGAVKLSLRGMVAREVSTTVERSPALHGGARDKSICVHCCTGSVAPRIDTGEFKQEILPRAGPAGLISPPVLGELSRLSMSKFEVHRVLPASTGLVGNSRGPRLRSSVAGSGALRNSPFILNSPLSLLMKITACRSLASAQTLPSASSTKPSMPSREGCCTRTLSRQSVLAVKVVSQPMLLAT